MRDVCPCHCVVCVGSREWLEASVVPKLREGLHALVNQLMTDRLALAAGSAWEEGPRPGEGGQQGTLYLPHGWKPFQPLRYAVCGSAHVRQAPLVARACFACVRRDTRAG